MLRALTERRSLSFAQIFGTGADLSLGHNQSGVTVDQDSALSFNALWACVRLLTSDISTLPVDAFRKRGGARVALDPQPSWLLQPDPFDPSVTRIDHFAQVAMSLLLDGNAFVLVTPSIMDPVRLEVLNPRKVEVRSAGKQPSYRLKDSRGQDSGDTLTAAEILHVKINRKPGALRGMSPVTANQEAIGIGIAAEKYIARFFGSGMSMQGFIEVPGDPTTPQLDEMRGLLEKRHGGWRRAHAFGFLTGGATFKQTTLSPKDADLTGLLKFQLEQAARAYGIPPFMVGSQEPSGVAYASSVERAQHYIDHALMHYIAPIEAAYNRLVPGDNRLSVPGADTYLKFNLNGFLRGDIKSRYEAYATGLQNKFLFQEDIARFEELDPARSGTYLETPNNNGPRDTPPAAPPVTNNSFTMADGAIRSNVEPAQVNVTTPAVTVEPAQVNITTPEVRNEITVQPAEVRIEAPITVQPASVVVTEEKRVVRKTVERDREGRIVALTEET